MCAVWERKIPVIRSVDVLIFLRYTPSKRSVLLWVEKSENTVSDYLQTMNMDFLDMLLTAKHLEGCSDKTIRYYRCNIEKMLDTINIPVIKITTEMLRKYLVEYQTINNCGKVTIDNIRRSLSTFFCG